MSDPSHQTGTDSGARVEGWKEIASYLNRGVRTVQRWEKEAGLPVRRVGSPNRESVFAFREELDAWLRTPRARAAADETPDEPGPKSSTRPAWWRRRSVVVAAVLVAAAASLAVLIVRPWLAEPAAWDLRNGRLVVVDAAGRLLWPVPLPASHQAPPRGNDYWQNRVAVADVDGDGTPEVLVAVGDGADGRDDGLYCFNSDGSKRFRWSYSGVARFGDGDYPPPYVPRGVIVDHASDGSPRVWSWGHHNPNYPSYLVRLDVTRKADPAILGEYWSAGFITTVASFRLAGRDTLLVGACYNDNAARGASLAVFFDGQVQGSSPVQSPRKRCLSCAPDGPARFFAFPRSPLRELENPAESTTSVYAFTGLSGDRFNVVMLAADSGYLGEDPPVPASAHYSFDGQFRLRSAELGGEYAALERRFVDRGFVPPRRWTSRDLLPVLSWDGKQFVRITELYRE